MWGRPKAETPADEVEVSIDEAETNKAKYARLNIEGDRELTSHAARRNGIVGRASTLVGAASIGASVSAASSGWLNVAGAVAFLAAAVLGVVALWPRTGVGLNLGGLMDDLFSNSSEELELALLQVKRKTLDEDEAALLRLAGVVRAGFASLAVAILLLAVGAGVAVIKGDKMNDEKPADKPTAQTGPPREPNPAYVKIEIKESGDRPTPPPARPSEKG